MELERMDAETGRRLERHWMAAIAKRDRAKAEPLAAQALPACVRSRGWRFMLDPNLESEQHQRLPVDQIAAMAQP
jgi:hypothetical protein